jgi:hypothetical protein
MLGYQVNPAWRDTSEHVVHFTRDIDDRSANGMRAAGTLERAQAALRDWTETRD